jgi:ferredoxin
MRVEADTQAVRRWLASAAAPTAVLVACREHENLDAWRQPGPGAPQVVYRLDGCLADVPPAALLEILAGGAVSVSGLLDGCANPSAARRVLDRAGRIAAAVAVGRPVHALTAPLQTSVAPPCAADQHSRFSRRPAPVQLLEVLDARAMPVSRRALVGLAGALGQVNPHPSLRLHAVVRELLGGAPVPSELEDIPSGAARLDAAHCCGNGVCVRTCPTQALTLRVTDLTQAGLSRSAKDPADHPHEPSVVGAAGFSNDALQQFVLSVDAARCIDCGQCVEQCPESAISRVGPLPWAQVLNGMTTTLRVGMVRRCSRCGVPYRTAGSLCAVCAFRTLDPFGSQLPPGFARQVRDQPLRPASGAAGGSLHADPEVTELPEGGVRRS